MVTEELILNTIEDFNKDRQKTMAEFIAEIFKDKYVEVYLGDSYEQISVEQISSAYPAIFFGKVIAAYKECIVLNSAFIDGEGKIRLGKYLFISERGIRGLTEIDGNGIFEDMFHRSSETNDIANHINTGMPFKYRKKMFKK